MPSLLKEVDDSQGEWLLKGELGCSLSAQKNGLPFPSHERSLSFLLCIVSA